MRSSASLPALCAGVLCVLFLSACGGGAGGTRQGSRANDGSGSSGQGAGYRWLVRTQGQPPSIAAENGAPGTTAWRLAGSPSLLGGAAHGPVEGYVAEQVIAPGESESIYVNAPGAHTVTVRVFRMGWYGGTGGRLVLQSRPLPATNQPPCTHRFSTGLTECRWHATLSFVIPPALPSGVYVVKLEASTAPSATVCSSCARCGQVRCSWRSPPPPTRPTTPGEETASIRAGRSPSGSPAAAREWKSLTTGPMKARRARASSSSGRWRWCASWSAMATRPPTRRSTRSTMIPARWKAPAR
jgi:hypothetical protein